MLTKMSLLKLQSCDGIIFNVDAATVKQMHMIQTMVDRWMEDSGKVVQIQTVNAQVLDKIIHWTEYHKVDHQKTEKIAWYIEYFDIDLKKRLKSTLLQTILKLKLYLMNPVAMFSSITNGKILKMLSLNSLNQLKY